jgi:hypothetical protein
MMAPLAWQPLKKQLGHALGHTEVHGVQQGWHEPCMS